MIIRTRELHQHRFQGPKEIGTVLVVADNEAIVAIRLVDDPADDAPPSRPLLGRARGQLEAYFTCVSRSFDLPLRPEGTEMQKQVWTFLQTIPHGETRSYGEVARAIGRPTSSRAVGAANGRNPLWVVVPCHRVIGANGSLTGYAGGIERKRWLLALEARSGVVQAADECRSLSLRAPRSSISCLAKDALSPLAS